MRKWNMLLGIASCGFGYWLRHYTASFPAGRAGVPGPGFFPALLGWTIFVLGILLTVAALLAPPEARREPAEARVSVQNLGRLAASMGLVVLWIVAWRRIPFEISCAVFVFAMATLQNRNPGKRDLANNFVLAAILCALVVAIFRYGLSVFI